MNSAAGFGRDRAWRTCEAWTSTRRRRRLFAGLQSSGEGPLRQTLKWAGAVSESLLHNSEAMEHREVEIAEGRLFRRTQPPTRSDGSLPSSGQQQGQVLDFVPVAVLQR